MRPLAFFIVVSIFVAFIPLFPSQSVPSTAGTQEPQCPTQFEGGTLEKETAGLMCPVGTGRHFLEKQVANGGQ